MSRPPTIDGRVVGADGFTQFVTHLFAHVRLAGPGNLADPRYVAWVGERLGEADRAMLDHDASLLARMWAADPRMDVLHGLCELHADLGGFRATANRSLGQLDSTEVGDPALLERLRELAAGEFVHSSLSAMLDGFGQVLAEIDAALERACASVQPWVTRLAVEVPELAGVSIELVWAMGEHGRALPSRILVGAVAAWNRLTPAQVAVQAAHEALVRSSELDEYLAVERWALAELGSRLARADPELRSAHARWLARLDRSGLGSPAP